MKPSIRSWLAGLGLVLLSAAPALAECKLSQLVELPVTMVGTRPTVTVSVNGKPQQFLVDSGAFYTTIAPEAATALGLTRVDIPLEIVGVGGRTKAQMAQTKAFNLGPLPIGGIDLLVAPGAGGGGVIGVLGENILGLSDVEYDLANGVVRLFKADGCRGTNLGYWANGGAEELPLVHSARLEKDPSSRDPSDAPTGNIDRDIRAAALVNGQRIDVTFDTGAGRSVLTLGAAARAGVTPQTPGAVSAGISYGFGPDAITDWIAPFDSFALGGEQIQHTRLRISSMKLKGSDMLLGADFFLSHRVFVANSQNKVFMTYNGGPVFRFDDANMVAARKAATEAAATPAAGVTDFNQPTDADGYMRRAAAFLTRRDWAHAIADADKVIGLEPKNADAFVLRGRARLAEGAGEAGLSDLDQAIALKPDKVEYRLTRAGVFAARRDAEKMKADLDVALRLEKGNAEIGLQAAGLYEAAGLFAEAIPQYDAWLAAYGKTPYAPAALNGRCWARAVLKQDLDKALVDCNAAIKASPRTSDFLDSRGLAHMDRGELDLAIADYDAALALQATPNPVTLYARGVAKTRKGMKQAGDADIAAATAANAKIGDAAKRYGLAP